MNKIYEKLIQKLGETKVLANENLAKYSSFKIGGPADIFFRAKLKDDLIAAIKTATDLGIPYFVIGGGTNLLIGDGGFRGIVIKNDTSEIKLLGMKGRKNSVQKVYLSVDSGVSINRLVRFTLDQGLGGLEFFLGQPGTVGGAVYINAHNMRRGQFFGDRVREAQILTKNGQIEMVPVDYFHFGYDKSILQKTHEIVLSVVLELTRGDKAKLWQVAQGALEYRQKTQPTGFFSSGCTFRNISKSEAVRLATPNYTTSAGYLLDRLGYKGMGSGGAMFSKDHANFIVHKGGAKASDVLKLIQSARAKVKEKFNIDLVEEIVIIGEF